MKVQILIWIKEERWVWWRSCGWLLIYKKREGKLEMSQNSLHIDSKKVSKKIGENRKLQHGVNDIACTIIYKQ